MNSLPSVEQSYSVELVRKSIHLCSLSIPIAYYSLSREEALSILLPITVAFAITDILRLYHPPSRRVFTSLFGWLLRSHELNNHQKRLNGATYVLLSATLCILVFPKVIVITAFAILIISDSVAALIGRRFGRRRFMKKSLEGSLAFLLSSSVVVLVTPKLVNLPQEYIIGAIGGIGGMIVEASPLPVDDNLSIPLSVGLIMWILYSLLLPSLDLHGLNVPT
jgi:dolichol kinase